MVWRAGTMEPLPRRVGGCSCATVGEDGILSFTTAPTHEEISEHGPSHVINPAAGGRLHRADR